MRVHRLQNPFEHWLRGLTIELLAFGGFLCLVALLVTIIAMAR